MTTLIINITELVNVRDTSVLLRGEALSQLPCMKNAFLLIEDDYIAHYGYMHELESVHPNLPENIIDASGQFILPCWCDSHSHIVFAQSREEEFIDKIRGTSYAEIAAKGGGILNSARKLNDTSEEELFISAWKRLEEISRLGTVAIEIKSGYGLTLDGELKMLRVIKRLKEKSKMTVKATFLAAHTYPEEYKLNHNGYIRTIINEMLPVVGAEKLADYIDVFCETGFFSPEEMELICNAGAMYGLKPKLHINQLNSIGGIESAIKLNALTVDHLETMSDPDIENISASSVIGTLLPTAAFFLRMKYQPARKLIDHGAAIALATDYNPGSSPAINAATMNAAFAMGVEKELGSIAVGKKASIIFTKPIPSLSYLPYSFGTDLIDKVMINGIFI